MALTVSSNGVADWHDRRFRCALGRSGVSKIKREGDGATPAGILRLRRVLFRGDRLAPPATILAVHPLSPHDGWCDAPEDPNYNRRVELPYPARCESLWRADHRYDIIVVTDHNDTPVRPGYGSAIFLHLATPRFAPTAGCIAFRIDDLLSILEAWRTDDIVSIGAAPDAPGERQPT